VFLLFTFGDITCLWSRIRILILEVLLLWRNSIVQKLQELGIGTPTAELHHVYIHIHPAIWCTVLIHFIWMWILKPEAFVGCCKSTYGRKFMQSLCYAALSL
jgi:hypothetical protein